MRLDQPFRGSEAIAAGLVTERQLRGQRFRRLHRDVHVLSEAPLDREARIRAALLRHPGAVVVGVTAAAGWDALDHEIADREAPVEIACDGGGRSSPGLLVRRDRLAPHEVVVRDGVAVTTPVRTALDVGRRLGTVDAVTVVEALIRAHGVTLSAVRDAAAEHPHARGLARLWTALEHVDPGARAALESRVRLALVAAGLPRPEVGHIVVDEEADLPLGVTDLAWPELRCAVLCDRDDDTARAMVGLLLALGWSVHRVDRDRWERERDRVVENVGHMLRVRRRAQRTPGDLAARIRATWPSRAPRRVDTVRLYP